MDTGTILDMGTIKVTSRVATITITGAVIATAGVGMEARSGEGSEDSGEEDGIER
jgi:Tfp pilus assembly protein PilZ